MHVVKAMNQYGQAIGYFVSFRRPIVFLKKITTISLCTEGRGNYAFQSINARETPCVYEF